MLFNFCCYPCAVSSSSSSYIFFSTVWSLHLVKTLLFQSSSWADEVLAMNYLFAMWLETFSFYTFFFPFKTPIALNFLAFLIDLEWLTRRTLYNIFHLIAPKGRLSSKFWIEFFNFLFQCYCFKSFNTNQAGSITLAVTLTGLTVFHKAICEF